VRRWLLVGAALLFAAAGAIAYALTRLDRYLTDERAALQAQASALLGRAVSFDAIGVSLRGGVSASVTNLAIADDPRFGAAPFLTAAHAEVALELLPALRGEYRVRRIVVSAPRVSLIRDAEGWNALSLARLDREPAGDAPDPTGRPAPVAPSLPPGAAALIVAAATIRDGVVTIVDRTRQPPLALSIDQLRVQARDLAVGEPLQFDLSAAMLGAAAPNLTARGRLEPGDPPRAEVQAEWLPVPLAALLPLIAGVAPDAAAVELGGQVAGAMHLSGPLTPAPPPTFAGSLTLSDVSVAVPHAPARLEQVAGVMRFSRDGAEFQTTSAALGGAPVQLGCTATALTEPVLHCRLSAAAIAAAQLGSAAKSGDVLRGVAVDAEVRPLDVAPVVHATVRVADGQLHGAPFRALDAALQATADQVAVTRFAGAAFDGTVTGSASCRGLRAAQLDCSAQGAATGLRIAPLLASQAAPGAGRIDGTVTASGRGSAAGRNAAAMLAAVSASGRVQVTDGVLRHVNLAQQIVGALPGVDALLRGPRVRALLGSSETRFDRLSATVQLAAQRATTNDAQVHATDFTATLSGSATLTGRLDGRGTFTLSPALAREVVGSVPLLATLTNHGGVTLPYTLSGTVDDPQVRPDAHALPKALERGLSGGVDALLRAPGATEKAGQRVLDDLNKLFHR
jgi:AsmA protein